MTLTSAAAAVARKVFHTPTRGWASARFHLPLIVLLLAGEAALTLLVIKYTAYTNIDWDAYMEEVGGYVRGERDYYKMGGGTGPLVYPAGFVYVYTALFLVTSGGAWVGVAQGLFAGLYVLCQALALDVYRQTGAVPLVAWAAVCVSKRVHSIFVLRLFNDAVAAAMVLLAVWFLCRRQWVVGCAWYSGAVSVKMSALLYAPGLFLVLLRGVGVKRTFQCISVCAAIQLVLGWPFLSRFPVAYLHRSFDLGRVFMYKWTVNFKFLPEEVFVSKPLAVALLLLHVGALVAFAVKWERGLGLRLQRQQMAALTAKGVAFHTALTPEYVATTLFTANFIGIAFARTVHYQFYAWYWHSLPFLLWRSALPEVLKPVVLVAVELAYNLHDGEGAPTPAAAALLQAGHLALLAGMWCAEAPTPYRVFKLKGGPVDPAKMA